MLVVLWAWLASVLLPHGGGRAAGVHWGAVLLVRLHMLCI